MENEKKFNETDANSFLFKSKMEDSKLIPILKEKINIGIEKKIENFSKIN